MGPAVQRSTFVWLLAAACFVVFLTLEPLLTYPVFGSDTGEYYVLTTTLLSTGHFAAQYPAYAGWGTGYPDFPGLFALSGAVSGALGVNALSALLVTAPVLGALSIVPLFLLFRRLFAHDLTALLGATFAGVAMPRVFTLAHPTPQAIGDFLVVGALWMYVEGRRDARWYFPLALTGGALIVTHHLSSYFFLLAALGALVAFELWRPGGWSRRFPLRELAFAGGFLTAMLAYWFYYAPRFIELTATGLGPLARIPVPLLLAAGLAVVAALGALVHLRRRGAARSGGRARFPTDRSLAVEISGIAGATVVGLALLLVVPLPPGNQHVTPTELLYYAPYYLPLALAAGTRRLLSLSRLGSFAVAWLLVLGLSVLVALATPTTIGAVLIPSRHVEFLAIPLGLLLALGLGFWVGRAELRFGRRALVAGGLAAALLIAGNAAIAYPPPQDLGGFQEGLTYADQALWLWAGTALAPHTTVASDHRLSSMLFGFDGLAATWDSTPALFTGSNRTAAFAELNASNAPLPPARPIDAVAVDATMYSGVALNPADLARPLSAAARGWLGALPFVPLYENGRQVVYWVDWGT